MLHSRSPLRIGLVDDHELFRREPADVLARAPEFLIVAEAVNGADAIHKISALRPSGLDLVLMDIDMPVMDGLTATAHISATDPDLAVVMLTVSTLDRDLFDALRAG